jgi:hypothetical protein
MPARVHTYHSRYSPLNQGSWATCLRVSTYEHYFFMSSLLSYPSFLGPLDLLLSTCMLTKVLPMRSANQRAREECIRQSDDARKIFSLQLYIACVHACTATVSGTCNFAYLWYKESGRRKSLFLHPELTKLKPTRVKVIDINLTISAPTANFVLVQLAIALDKSTL